MASVNALARELVFKIVYYGPGLSGKTTTLEYLHATAKPEHRGKLVSLATPVDRTLYFDFLPMRLPPVRGMNVRLQLFTVPGQVYFNSTRKLVITGADGIVFVSDSQIARADANLESLENLKENLREQGKDISQIPIVFQHNKRDLPDLLPVEELDSILNPWGAPSVPTSARIGEGVYEALEKICEEVLKAFELKLPELQEEKIELASSIEGGLAMAIRNASPAAPPNDVVVARLPDPNDTFQNLSPDTVQDSQSAAIRSIAQSSDLLPATIRRPESGDKPTLVPSNPKGFSFAELWPQSHRNSVLRLELAIQEHKTSDACALCEELFSQILTETALLTESPNNPESRVALPLLLGLGGPQTLSFRSFLRKAQTELTLPQKELLSAYAFLTSARIALNSIR